MTHSFTHPNAIRARFSEAMSAMYRAEVPLYGDLLSIVATVNAQVLADRPALAAEMADELDRLDVERHGAIRLGTAAELNMMRRAFAVMGMYPVGYYDLSVAGVPVHSTAFRPVDDAALAANPFRVFTSLLRLELIEDDALRAEAESILSTRRIFTDEAIRLIERDEAQGGLDAADDRQDGYDQLLGVGRVRRGHRGHRRRRRVLDGVRRRPGPVRDLPREPRAPGRLRTRRVRRDRRGAAVLRRRRAA